MICMVSMDFGQHDWYDLHGQSVWLIVVSIISIFGMVDISLVPRMTLKRVVGEPKLVDMVSNTYNIDCQLGQLGKSRT